MQQQPPMQARKFEDWRLGAKKGPLGPARMRGLLLGFLLPDSLAQALISPRFVGPGPQMQMQTPQTMQMRPAMPRWERQNRQIQRCKIRVFHRFFTDFWLVGVPLCVRNWCQAHDGAANVRNWSCETQKRSKVQTCHKFLVSWPPGRLCDRKWRLLVFVGCGWKKLQVLR